jgi:hypothetical protein
MLSIYLAAVVTTDWCLFAVRRPAVCSPLFTDGDEWNEVRICATVQ